LLGRVLDSSADLEVLAIAPIEVDRGGYQDSYCSGYRPMRLTTVLAFGEIGLSDLVVGDRQVAPAPARVQHGPGRSDNNPGNSPILLFNVNVRVRVWGR
jgi:hypothetical protein